MKRKDYLAKKFEYYQHMKKLRNEEHKYLTERLKLEITVLETRARRELVNELTEHILSDKFKHDIMSDVKENTLKWVKEELTKSVEAEMDKLVKFIEANTKALIKQEGKRSCDKCDLYGECDHQGAYQKDGKWCYEEEKKDLSGEPAKESLMEKKKDEVNSGTGC